MKKITAILLVICMLLPLCACKKQPQDQQQAGPSPDEVFMSSANFSISLAEATYIFYESYNNYYSANADNISFLALDSEKSLKIQSYSDGSTWYEFFLEDTKEMLRWVLLYCEAAKAAGYEIDDGIRGEAKKVTDSIKQFATDYAYDPAEHIKERYGSIVTEETIRTYLEKYFLANKFYNELEKNYKFTEADEDAYRAAHPEKFSYVDLVIYSMRESLDREASANARELLATKTSDEFYDYIEKYESEVIKQEVGVDEQDYVSNTGNELSKWAFSAKVGDKYLHEDPVGGVYTVCMLTTAPTVQEYNVRDVRIIVLDADRYSSMETALSRTDEVIKKWQEGEATAESFGKLAKVYSADANAENGSAYSDVDKSFDYLTDEASKWLFEEAKAGELKKFEFDNGYFVLYCEAEGRVQWRVLASDYLIEEKYYSDLKKFEEAHPITFVDAMAWHIDA
jgi:hypothetical protein